MVNQNKIISIKLGTFKTQCDNNKPQILLCCMCTHMHKHTTKSVSSCCWESVGMRQGSLRLTLLVIDNDHSAASFP